MSIESEEFEKDLLIRASYRKSVDSLDEFGTALHVRTLPISKKEVNAVNQLLHFIECVEGKAAIWPHEDDYQIFRIRMAFEILCRKKPSLIDRTKALRTFNNIRSHRIESTTEIDVKQLSVPDGIAELCEVLLLNST